jgi:hypothetical protein
MRTNVFRWEFCPLYYYGLPYIFVCSSTTEPKKVRFWKLAVDTDSLLNLSALIMLRLHLQGSSSEERRYAVHCYVLIHYSSNSRLK